MKIEFYKYQGTGNDFIMVDNRQGLYTALDQKQVKFMCNHHFGVGADGLILLGNHREMDFEMKYFNADGKEGTMCGNGGRCIIKFASLLGIRKNVYHFNSSDGLHEADIDLNGMVRLKMKNVGKVEAHSDYFILNTGSPHYVKMVPDVMNVDVKSAGYAIRNSKDFVAEGINVNFVESLGDDEIYVRTYERGVEDETLSCGTGVTASALVSAHNDNGFNRVEVRTLGGKLSVEFDKLADNQFSNIWLNGSADLVFKGEMEVD